MKPDAVRLSPEAASTNMGRRIVDAARKAAIPVKDHGVAGFTPTKRTLSVKIRKGRWLKPFSDARACGSNEYFLCAVEGCPHDCAYCFVGGYLEDRSTTVYANTDDMESEIFGFLSSDAASFARVHAAHLGELVEWEEWTGLCASLCGLFKGRGAAELEIRTKTAIRAESLWSDAPANVVFSWTLTPQRFSGMFEPGLPGPAARLEAAAAAAKAGARIGLRLDPVILLDGWEDDYSSLASLAGEILSRRAPDSMEIGAFRCSASAAEAIRSGAGRSILAGEVTRSADGKYRYPWQSRALAYKRIISDLRREFGSCASVRLCMEPDWMNARVNA